MRLQSLARRRPSPAIVVSSLALFISLGGAGYAATQLPNGSVGNAQLQNNSVSYKKIVPGSVGIVRANTGQLQVRVSGTCATGTGIGTINSVGKVTCNPALPAEYGTTNNTISALQTATTPQTVTSVALPTGPSYVGFANPTATVTGNTTEQSVTVTCTLTIGSNTETRSATVDTGTRSTTSDVSIPLQVAGGSGTGTVTCQSATDDTTASTAAAVSVTSALNVIQTASNS